MWWRSWTMGAVVEYGILGPLQIARGGGEVALTAPKLRALLLVLLVNRDRVVSVDRLIDAVWPDAAPTTASKLVQVYVSQLRAALGGDEIETVAPGYRLALGSNALDAARFERLHCDSRRARAEGNAELALALAERALALWRGPPLADVTYAPFALAEAARLEDLRIDCVEDRLEAELALGRHELVVPELQRLCAEHPLRERTRERLAVALYRVGRQADALAVLADGRRVLRDELGLDPGPGYRRLEQAILIQSPSLEVPAVTVLPRSLLPMPPSPLVGRKHELQRLTALIGRDDARLVTVTGAGGSGKTRLALELARSAGTQFANGTAFIELASVPDPSLVMTTIAQSLGVGKALEETPEAATVRRLRGLEFLLVLDNFEHVINAAPGLAQLVRNTDRLTVLVTSRRVLHVSGEYVFPLQPLRLDDARRLFADRVAARDPDVDVSGSTEKVVDAICRRLDCLPLALELAAARVATMTPQDLFDRLTDRVAALSAGPRDAPARQRTLTDTMRWSTDLLRDDERRAFARLSVFAGGCTLDAAEAVGGTSLDVLAALVDSSLLQRRPSGEGDRVMMLETLREHAATCLDTADRALAEAAHAAYYTALTSSLDLRGAEAQRSFQLIDGELDNLRAAFDRSRSVGDDETALRLATNLGRYWYVRGLYQEGCERIAGPLERGAGDAELRACAVAVLGLLTYMRGDLDTASALAIRGCDAGTSAGTFDAVCRCHNTLGLVALDRNHLAEAQEHLERCEALATQHGLDEYVTIANDNLADLAMTAGDLDQGRQRWERTVARNRAVKPDPFRDTRPRLGLGDIARRQGLLDEADDHYTRAHLLAEQAGSPHFAACALVGLATIAADRSQHLDAATLLASAQHLLDSCGVKLTGIDAAAYDEVRATTLEALGAQQLAILLEANEQAIDTAR